MDQLDCIGELTDRNGRVQIKTQHLHINQQDNDQLNSYIITYIGNQNQSNGWEIMKFGCCKTQEKIDKSKFTTRMTASKCIVRSKFYITRNASKHLVKALITFQKGEVQCSSTRPGIGQDRV